MTTRVVRVILYDREHGLEFGATPPPPAPSQREVRVILYDRNLGVDFEGNELPSSGY